MTNFQRGDKVKVVSFESPPGDGEISVVGSTAVVVEVGVGLGYVDTDLDPEDQKRIHPNGDPTVFLNPGRPGRWLFFPEELEKIDGP